MPIFKKILFKEWFKSFFLAFITLILLVTVANLISGFLRSSVTPTEVIKNYILDLPVWFNKVLPISSLTATLFSLNNLRNRNELMAILAGGFSRKSVVLIIIQASLIVACFQFINNAVLMPLSKRASYIFLPETHQKFKDQGPLGNISHSINSGKIWYKSSDYILNYSAFDKSKNAIKDLVIYKIENNNLTSIISSPLGINIENRVWSLSNARIIKVNDNNSFPAESKIENFNIDLQEDVSDFYQIDSDVSTLGIIALTRFIFRMNKNGINTNEYQMLLYEKYSSAIICIIFALLSISILFRPSRRHSSFGKNIALSFIFSILYFFFNSSMLSLGASGKLHPFISSFLMPLLFLIYSTIVLYRNRSLS